MTALPCGSFSLVGVMATREGMRREREGGFMSRGMLTVVSLHFIYLDVSVIWTQYRSGRRAVKKKNT